MVCMYMCVGSNSIFVHTLNFVFNRPRYTNNLNMKQAKTFAPEIIQYNFTRKCVHTIKYGGFFMDY